MEEKGHIKWIKEIKKFLEEQEMNGKTQQPRAWEIEETLKEAKLFDYWTIWKEFKNEALVWERVLQRMGIPREKRIHAVFGSILVMAYEKAKRRTVQRD